MYMGRGRGIWGCDVFGVVAAYQEGVWRIKKGLGMSKCIGIHQRVPRHVCEVVARTETHEGHVRCMWDGSSTLRGGWACQRGWVTSRGAGSHPEEWGMSWVVMGQLTACHRLWGGLPGCGGGEKDVWLRSGCMHISMGPWAARHGCYKAG